MTATKTTPEKDSTEVAAKLLSSMKSVAGTAKLSAASAKILVLLRKTGESGEGLTALEIQEQLGTTDMDIKKTRKQAREAVNAAVKAGDLGMAVSGNGSSRATKTFAVVPAEVAKLFTPEIITGLENNATDFAWNGTVKGRFDKSK